jgi:hypothetical protein
MTRISSASSIPFSAFGCIRREQWCWDSWSSRQLLLNLSFNSTTKHSLTHLLQILAEHYIAPYPLVFYVLFCTPFIFHFVPSPFVVYSLSSIYDFWLPLGIFKTFLSGQLIKNVESASPFSICAMTHVSPQTVPDTFRNGITE